MYKGPPYCLDTCLVSHPRQVVFAYVCKAASSSIKKWLVVHAGFAPEATPADILSGLHPYLQRNHRLTPSAANSVLTDPAYFKFTFVRNPLPRLVSAYLDRVVHVKNSARRIIRNFQIRQRLLGVNAVRNWWGGGPLLDPARLPSFREFVEQLARENPARLDPHFRAQWRLLRGLPLDFVGRVENSQQDFQVVQERLGVFVPLPRQHTRSYVAAGAVAADWPAERFLSPQTAPPWRQFYDEPLLALAGRLFADDFAQFGYRCTLHEASNSRQAA